MPESSPSSESEWVSNQTDLAVLLGLSEQNGRRQIGRLLKHAECPGHTPDGRYNVPSWLEFYGKHGRKAKQPSRQKLEEEILAIKRDHARHDLNEAIGLSNGIDETCSVLSEMAAAFRRELETCRHDLAPAVVGVSVPEASSRMRDTHDRVLAKLSVPDWCKKKAFWRSVSAKLSDLQRIACPGDGAIAT